MGADVEGEGCDNLDETLEDKLESFLRDEDLAAGALREASEEELEGIAQDEGCEVDGLEETLEEKLESILNDEAFCIVLPSVPTAVAPDTAPAPTASSEDATAAAAATSSAGDAPVAVASSEEVAPAPAASSEHESGHCEATDVEPSDWDPQEEPQASLADMATLALQLEAMRAILACEAEAGSGIPDGAVAEDASALADASGLHGADAESAHAGAAAHEEADAKRTMVSAKRWDLQRNIFRCLDQDGDGRLSCAELLAFAVLAGFDGSEEDWAEDFKDLCDAHAGGDEGGPTLPCFRAMLDDTSDDGLHCTDKELAGLHAKLLRQKAEGVKPRKSMLRKRPLVVPLELLAPGPKAAQPKPPQPFLSDYIEPDFLQLEAPAVPQASAQASGGAAPGGAELAADGDDDPPAVARHDPVEAIDIEELLRKAWEERDVEGEKLGDSEEEEEGEDVAVEVWGDPERDPQPAKARGAPGRTSARRRDPRETDVTTEVVAELGTEAAADAPTEQLAMATEMATEQLEMATEMVTEQLEMATEMATEMVTEVVEVRRSSKRSVPVGDVIMKPALGDDSTVLDELLVQAGVAHLAEERESKKRAQKRPAQQEGSDGRPQTGDAERPAKQGRRGALRGGSATTAPDSAAQAESLAALRQELVKLGTPESMRDRRVIPDLAGRIAAVHLPVIGAGRALNAMATTFMRQDVPRPHKLAIMYVFHELLLANALKGDFVADGAKHFLEPIGQTVARLPQDKLGPFLKLLGMWAHVYTDRFLKHLRGAWTSAARAGSGHSRSASLRT